jgi:hypothetical protein
VRVDARSDLAAQVAVIQGKLRAALERGLTSEEQESVAELAETLRLLLGEQGPNSDDPEGRFRLS